MIMRVHACRSLFPEEAWHPLRDREEESKGIGGLTVSAGQAEVEGKVGPAVGALHLSLGHHIQFVQLCCRAWMGNRRGSYWQKSRLICKTR